jgi:DNA-binding MarR family transcriptional regulator
MHPGDLEEATEAALVASRALLGVVAASLVPVLGRVTLPQFRVLVLLHSLGPTRSGALAERLDVHPSTFSRTTDRLVTSGWVSRLESPVSKREVLVDLTPKGRRLVASVLHRRAEAIREILAPLSAEQRQQIVHGLAAFSAAAGEPGHEEAAAMLGG